MQPLDKTPELLPRLQSFEVFQDIAPEALQWLIDRSDYKLYPKGTHMFEPGQAVDHMQIILAGEYLVQLEREGELQDLGTWSEGYVTGVLPFSRMREARAYGRVLEDCRVLELHKQHFTEMVNVSYALTQNLVATMSNRIREFTGLRFQSEKLMSLGRLSAGLAHELNNPASAMVRSAQELYQKVHKSPERFKAVITLRVTPEQTDAVNAIMYARIREPGEQDLSLLEREEKLDELIDWLDEQEVEHADDIADTFVDFNLSVDELERINEIIEGEGLSTILWWIESTLSLEKLVNEIQEASHRISTLVQSVKEYSHMDRAQSKERIDLHDGLRSTLIMLKHKFTQGGISLEKDWNKELPRLDAYPGELNQVWTNLISNALDAMPEGGTLQVRTYRQHDYLCVDVTDSGVGIPEEHLSQIFDPFFTTRKVGEGTGMGLEITQRIVERHKGRIQVESKPGRTTFTVCLPLQPAAQPAQP